jgi:hypothetical protein
MNRGGYVNFDYHNIPDCDAWHEVSWKVQDANFVGAWGWNFRLNAISSPNEFLTKRDKGQQGSVDIFQQ